MKDRYSRSFTSGLDGNDAPPLPRLVLASATILLICDFVGALLMTADPFSVYGHMSAQTGLRATVFRIVLNDQFAKLVLQYICIPIRTSDDATKLNYGQSFCIVGKCVECEDIFSVWHLSVVEGSAAGRRKIVAAIGIGADEPDTGLAMVDVIMPTLWTIRLTVVVGPTNASEILDCGILGQIVHVEAELGWSEVIRLQQKTLSLRGHRIDESPHSVFRHSFSNGRIIQERLMDMVNDDHAL